MSKTHINSTKSTKTLPVMERNIVPLLGIEIDSSHMGQLLDKAVSMLEAGVSRHGSGSELEKNSSFLIVTPNPEIVLGAYSDDELRLCLNKADMSIPDAIGIIAAMKYLSLPKPKNRLMRIPVAIIGGVLVGSSIIFNRRWLESESEVVPGRLMMEELISKAVKMDKARIFLLGGKSGIATKASGVFSQKYGISQMKSEAGPNLDMNGKPVTQEDKSLEKNIITAINDFQPDLLFVAFGFPKQEKWLNRNLPHLKVGIAMTVGGAFDYASGVVPMPPQVVSQTGFEWLWRLVTQPYRARRVFNAVVMFPLRVFIESLKG